VLYGVAEALFSNYKSEWLTAGSMIPIIILLGFINSLIFCTLSIPIFFSYLKAMRNSALLNAIIWFAGPAAWVAYIVVKTGGEFDFSRGIDSIGITYLINLIPYVIALPVSFIQFRRKVNADRTPISQA
jgi:hypothetical protein